MKNWCDFHNWNLYIYIIQNILNIKVPFCLCSFSLTTYSMINTILLLPVKTSTKTHKNSIKFGQRDHNGYLWSLIQPLAETTTIGLNSTTYSEAAQMLFIFYNHVGYFLVICTFPLPRFVGLCQVVSGWTYLYLAAEMNFLLTFKL